MAEQGCLVLADISGYSAYLNEAELDHARDSLASLIQILIDHTRSPLVLIELEGDAVFSYAPAGSFEDSQTLVAFVENTYAEFRKALELMVLNTTCRCNACRLLPSLDLKFFIHHGEFVLQELAERTKLVGHDVNLLHRVMKNTITKTTGVKAYAAYTAAVIETLNLGAMATKLEEHRESFPDVGELSLYIQDMHGVWERLKDTLSLAVKPENAIIDLSYEFPIPPPALWEYLTLPEYRAVLMNSTYQELKRGEDGLTGPGSAYYCAHGKDVFVHTVVEWEPFERYTVRETTQIPNVFGKTTYVFEPTTEGTRLQILSGNTTGPVGLRQFAELMWKMMAPKMMGSGISALKDLIEQHLAEGRLKIPGQSEISGERVREAAKVSLGSGIGPTQMSSSN
jgi:hypothetical protein